MHVIVQYNASVLMNSREETHKPTHTQAHKHKRTTLWVKTYDGSV
jgi:hypothetical protein